MRRNHARAGMGVNAGITHIRPDGSHIDYTWNARNLLSELTPDAPPPVASYTYNGRNQIASTAVENGLFTATRGYDAAGRLTGITNGTLDTTAYTLTPDGRRDTITRNGQEETYGYDNARQVTSASYGGLATTQSWNYDPAGNRISSQISNPEISNQTTNYTPNAVNAYTNISGGGFQPPPPTYDQNGNALTWNVRPGGLPSSSLLSSVFTWNIHNELTSATNSSGDTASYAYDALGRRVKRVETINGAATTTWFFYNGWNVELEHNGNAYTRRHTWGLDLSNSLQGAGGVGGLLLVEHLDTGRGLAEPYYPTYDGNGNITAWIDATGAVIARQRYDAYGNILHQTGTAPSNYGFSTKPIDQLTGLLYYGYRYLDPVTGRWINRDPIEEEGGMNLYGFNLNAPIDRFDNLGHESRDEREAERRARNEANKDGRRNNQDNEKTRNIGERMNRNSPTVEGLGYGASRRARGVGGAIDAAQEVQDWISDFQGFLSIVEIEKRCQALAEKRKSSEGWTACQACCLYTYIASSRPSGRIIRNDIQHLNSLTVYEGRCTKDMYEKFKGEIGEEYNKQYIISTGEVLRPRVASTSVFLCDTCKIGIDPFHEKK